MADRRPPTPQLVWMGIVLVLVLVVVGRLVLQWLAAPDERPAPAPFDEQVQALIFVEEVRTESDRVVGSPTVRSLESWITLSSEHVRSDPAAVATGLAGVTWGYDASHWSIDGLPSTAYVSDLGPVAEEPVGWWAGSVAALAEADPDAALHCEILNFALRCEVESTQSERALQALAGVDGTAIGPWLEGVDEDEGEEKGFSLTVGGQTFTDAEAVG